MSKLSISNEASDNDHTLDNITDYQKLIGKLIYLTNTRPHISYDVHCLSQFMHSSLKSRLKSCPCLGIHVIKNSGMNLKAFSDVDWAKCVVTRKSITGYQNQDKVVKSPRQRRHFDKRPFNGGNCRRYTNVSFGDEFIRNPDPISYDETPDFSYPPLQPQTYSCELCGNDSHYGFDCPSRSYGFDQPTQTSIDHQPPKEMSVRELLLQEKLHKALQAVCEMLNQQEQAANVSTYTPELSRHFNFIYDDDDDDEESTIPLNEIISQIPPSIAITPVLPTIVTPPNYDTQRNTTLRCYFLIHAHESR
ncbi:ribonuclease H-like domain-containing protein [Tanacetum coccineum]